ncbi:tetratricopeptide repeat protein [Streptacidiphilus sp. PB12-B1b]|uniref:AfsR/SARP family transcriptional regulator n=1 Tax=Streptacidiphilus sp. PB12-B1b TaxID=2705012 RepID=UPI0015FAE343|nr:BTAD domain-containing putative transcriptional regulator [Streptacidiphilus sp. PB12-B1b]QMU74626.1 tetratricopeptide repeat protein [Streptacidiphilus sp. PB12-B1b]
MPSIKVLGPLVLSVGGRQATPRGARERKLLALLALNANSIVATERIVDALWESPPHSARQQIHNVVGALRRTLMPAVGVELVTDSSGYQLNVPTEAMDALQFRSTVEEAANAEQQGRLEDATWLLDEALGLWRGNALGGLDGWVLTNAATQLDAQRLAAVERLAELRLRMGKAGLALEGLAGMMAEHPLREPLRALLMTALYQCGRQSEAMAVFEEGRRLLAEELGLDPGPQLREAHQQILLGETQEPAKPSASEPRAERPPEQSPGQGADSRSFLPRDIPEFTGREEELRRLRTRPLESNAPAISVIDGMGGVGKTSLAVHMAHLLAAYYPDGQYFVDLAGFSQQAEPMSPLQALNLLLRFDGMAPELIAPDLEARSAQWRSCLVGRRVLILLDNAADPTQLRSLLPGSAGSLVLISSRRRMAELEGAASLSLDVMTEADAIALFCRVAGPERVAGEPDEVRSAVELCGYLPLAIQIAAARLRERSSWRVSFLVGQLRDNESRARILAAGDRDVMNIVAWSYHHLTKRQQRLLGLLSLHTGPDFDSYATAALASLPLHQVEADLDKLFELNLLKQHAADRYHLHDIVRDCARRLLDATVDRAEAAEAVGRLADYYLWSADSWCRLLTKTSLPSVPKIDHRPEATRSASDVKHAMRLLEAEFRCIVATLRLTADLGQHHRVWQTMSTLRPYLSALNHPADSGPMFELGRLAARADGSLVGEAACLAGLAEAQLAHGTPAEAEKLSERALALSRQAGDRTGEISQLNSLGRIHWTTHDLDRAGTRYEEALRVAHELGDGQLQAGLTNNLAIISRELGRNEEALRYFLEARSLGETSLSPGAEASILNNTGLVSVVLGDWEGAAAVYQQSLELSRAAGTEQSEVLALVGLCIVRRGMGLSSEAMMYGRAALEIARRTSMYEGEAQALNALGDIHACDGELALAEQVFQQCLKAAAARDSTRYVARAHEGLAHVAALRDKPAQAVEHWEAALSTHPGGLVDATGAARHLAAPHDRAATCWRCVAVGSS